MRDCLLRFSPAAYDKPPFIPLIHHYFHPTNTTWSASPSFPPQYVRSTMKNSSVQDMCSMYPRATSDFQRVVGVCCDCMKCALLMTLNHPSISVRGFGLLDSMDGIIGTQSRFQRQKPLVIDNLLIHMLYIVFLPGPGAKPVSLLVVAQGLAVVRASPPPPP